MSARRFTRGALAATTVAAVGAATFALGQPSSQAAEADDTITGRTAQESNVDVGRKGPSVGDRYVFSENLFSEKGTRIGRLAASCEINFVKRNSKGRPTDALMQCLGTFRLTDGQITVQGATWWSDKKIRLAITGGTGRYDGSSGNVEITDVNDKKSEYDFDFANTNRGVIP